MRDNQMSENQYLDDMYGDDDEAARLDEHLEEIAYNDPAGGFTAAEIDFLTSDEARFPWLLASDFSTIRAWLDTGKDIYPRSTPAADPVLEALKKLLDSFIHDGNGKTKGNQAKTDIIKYNEDVRCALNEASAAIRKAVPEYRR